MTPETSAVREAIASPGPRTDPVRDVRAVLRNAAALLGAYAVPRALTFAAAVVAARVLGVVEFGAYVSAASLAVILSLLATLGMLPLLVREVARAPDRAGALIGAAHVAKAGSTAVMLLAVWTAAAGLLGYPSRVVAAALLLGAAYGVGAFVENLGGYLQGVERMGVWLRGQALYGVTFGVAGIAAVLLTRDLLWFCAAPLAGQAVALVWLLRQVPPDVRAPGRPDRRRVAELVRALLPFAAAFLVLSAYYKVDVLLVERWRGLAEAGVYGAAYRFIDVAQALSVVVAGALYPRLSRRWGGQDGAGAFARRASGRTGELMLLAMAPAAGLLWLVRSPLILALFGDDYAAAVPALARLAPLLPLLALNSLGVFVLAAMDRMRRVAALYVGGLLLNVTLNALWVPAAGAVGAATAMLVSELAVAVVTVALLRAAGAAPAPRPALIAAAAGALAVVAGVAPVPVAGSALLYGAAVGACYALLGVVPAEDRAVLIRAVRR